MLLSSTMGYHYQFLHELRYQSSLVWLPLIDVRAISHSQLNHTSSLVWYTLSCASWHLSLISLNYSNLRFNDNRSGVDIAYCPPLSFPSSTNELTLKRIKTPTQRDDSYSLQTPGDNILVRCYSLYAVHMVLLERIVLQELVCLPSLEDTHCDSHQEQDWDQIGYIGRVDAFEFLLMMS